ncbi:GEVED domain-containing protein [Polaribacter vadi]|uniref:zinc-dependent metalloprotease n=1 Tax=Polaribacter vadi TaxID=1774273 RepID=UPI0030EF7024|tara:strand:- start:989 stop:2788 length:1800 start_codon:yes stop_codon:yes gene_type:complete
MKFKVLFVLILLQASLLYSQEKCGFTKHQEEFYELNPKAKLAHDKVELNLLKTGIQEFLSKKNADSNTIYEIPVVVHLMNDGTTPLRTEEEIITWIDNCNKFYDTTFGGEWLTEANGGTVIPFRLVLAKRNPSCEATSGINQINVTSTYAKYSEKGLNSDNEDGVSEAQLRALSRWDPQMYYNIYVVNTFDSTPITQTGGLQGYAYFPTTPDSFYGTFMKSSVVVDKNDPTTLPHEFGHAMGLHHPFRTGSTSSCPTVSPEGCSVDNDLVCDTPSTVSLLGVNPLPSNADINGCDSAGWNNVQFNVMNYTSSSRLFSQGQKDRALALFLASRENLTKSLGGTAVTNTTEETVIATTCVPPSVGANIGNFQFGMTLVEIENIKNSSDASNINNANKAYYDYTTSTCLTNAYSTELVVANNPQTIKIKNGGPNPGVYSAWIDYNNDGLFSSEELIVTDQSIRSTSDGEFSFTIPSANVILDIPLRMRVIGDRLANSTKPCESLEYGEAEDYIVILRATTLGVKNFVSEFVISPNPSLGIVNINYDKTISEVTVVNIAGQTVFNQKYDENKVSLDISNLSPAIYFIKIKSENKITTKKIIKK